MFDDRREETVRNAKRATWDQSYELSPLFPNGDHTEPPLETGITNEVMEPVRTEDDEHGCAEQLTAPTCEDAVTVDAVRHVLIMKKIAPPPAPLQWAVAAPTALGWK